LPQHTTPCELRQQTGLGLSLAKRIVEEHHGRIEVESKLDKGTTFSGMLPVRQAATAAV